MNQDSSLKGKVVLVTGAGKGIGRKAAEAFAARGAAVAVNDVSPVNLDDSLARIVAAGGKARAYVEDIAKKMPVQTLLNQVLDDFGRLDILINCATVEPSHSILEMDEWDWQRSLDVNLTGPFLLTQSAGRIMKEKNSGIIIHVIKNLMDVNGRSACLAARAGAAAWIEIAAQELAGFGVRVCLAHTLEEVLKVCSL
jgi:NAD(P)-dependent dehydrogenase (short-subunit alcohol dehydrogenase family)